MARVQESIRPSKPTLGGSRPQSRSSNARVATPATPVVNGPSCRRIPPFALASLLIAGITLLSFHPRVRVNLRLEESVWGSAVFLLVLLCAVLLAAARGGRALTYAFVPVKAHYVQLVMHSSIYLYWGWYWPHIYHAWPLILIQLLFAYVFDMCICWLRRDQWILGLGIFPIVLSTNLFLTFRDDWFYFQFAMLVVAVLCKEFIKWTRDNRRTHIFNPSAIGLCIASIALILTNTTYMTWGETIANMLRRPPHIYLELFLLGLIVQAIFSVTCVTFSAAAVLYVLNLAFTGMTGLYYFFDSGISVSLFLGLHLLVTDPATSPRTPTGKLIFGGLYGAAVFATYGLLGWLGVPQFYDKLLCVPLLNLSVRWIDRTSVALTRSLTVRFPLPRWSPRWVNFACMAAWSSLFVLMMSTGFLTIPHPGEDPRAWQKACETGNGRACQLWEYLLRLECDHGSAGSCLTLGNAFALGRPLRQKPVNAGEALIRACDLGSQLGCTRAAQILRSGSERELLKACYRSDNISCITLASLYGRGAIVPKDDTRSLQLFMRACANGWSRPRAGRSPKITRMVKSFRQIPRRPQSFLGWHVPRRLCTKLRNTRQAPSRSIT